MNSADQLSNRIRQLLARHQPVKLALNRPKAAVLLPIVLAQEPAVLLTTRSSQLKSHPGQVSFPGGMSETFDKTLMETALRETTEEVGILAERVELVGELSTTVSKDGVVVTPFVGLLREPLEVQVDPGEISEVFYVPWSFFAETEPELQSLERQGMMFEMPHYYFEGHHIWGLTAMILLELINLVEGTSWPLPNYSTAVRSNAAEE